MIREEIKNLVEGAIESLQNSGEFPAFAIPEIVVEHPENKGYGDYSTNAAFQLAKLAKKSPFEIAEDVKSKIANSKIKIFQKVEAPAGFMNFFVSEGYLQERVREILKQKDKFGEVKTGRGQKVNVEFISANPTGPLTLGNGRGGFCGDVLASILQKAGFKAEREYYVNDAGEQVRKLGHSVLDDEEAVYRGKYIEDLKSCIKENDVQESGEKAARIILNETIKPTVKKMGIKFDVWFSERTLHEKGEVKKVLDFLKKKNLAYEKDDALWFKSTQFGDDKDRVLIKADGETTYLASDFSYLKNKFERGFERLIFFWGADHYGYIERLKDAAIALGYKKEQLDIVIMQLVKLFQGGQEVKMSKRTGIYVTIDELIDEVGLDAARFFFLSRVANTHLDFDMDLAKEQSEKNPVYYVQYAHARICSILEKVKSQEAKGKTENLKLLTHKSEFCLIKELIRLPEIVEDTAKDFQIQRLPQYSVDLATAFHAFYRDCQVISDNAEMTNARVALISATKIVLENTLNLMGISAPEKM